MAGAPGKWQLTNTTIDKILSGQFALTADTIKCALIKSTSNLSVSSTTFAGVTDEVSGVTGYTAGGNTLTITASNGDLTFSTNWTPTSGSLVARWACVYESGGHVIMFCLLDSTPADYTCLVNRKLTLNCSGIPVPALRLAVA